MLFAAGRLAKRLDVIITIMKTVKLCNVMFRVPPGMQKVGSEIFSLAMLAILYPTLKTVAPPLLW